MSSYSAHSRFAGRSSSPGRSPIMPQRTRSPGSPGRSFANLHLVSGNPPARSTSRGLSTYGAYRSPLRTTSPYRSTSPARASLSPMRSVPYGHASSLSPSRYRAPSPSAQRLAPTWHSPEAISTGRTLSPVATPRSPGGRTASVPDRSTARYGALPCALQGCIRRHVRAACPAHAYTRQLPSVLQIHKSHPQPNSQRRA
jgi:hypothetical protein